MRHQCIILAGDPAALQPLAGISLLERLLRHLQRLGLTKAILLSPTPEQLARQLGPATSNRSKVTLEFRIQQSAPVSVESLRPLWPNEPALVLPAEVVFDPRLLQLLDQQTAAAALVDSAVPSAQESLVAQALPTTQGRLCGAALLTPDWLASHHGPLAATLAEAVEKGELNALDVAKQDWYLASMRRDLRAYWFPAPLPAEKKRAERVLHDAAQKGTLDLPALVHAPIETFLVSHLCQTPITPNQLTVFSNLVAWSATFLFLTGRVGWGVLLALAVGVLDGLDGKQARVKVETSKAGKLEHWFDALFENSWWLALAWHFWRSGQLPSAFLFLLLLVAGEALGGLAKWSIIRRRGHSIYELGGFDRFVRLVGARRNVHVWTLAVGVLLGAPAQAFIVIACWEAITSAIQLLRAGWTLAGPRAAALSQSA